MPVLNRPAIVIGDLDARDSTICRLAVRMELKDIGYWMNTPVYDLYLAANIHPIV